MRSDDVDDAVPAGPPWSLEVLADLHAGRYPAQTTAELRRKVAADPASAAVLSALDATVDQLSLLPTPRMPEGFALRLDAAIAAERRAAATSRGATVGAATTGGPSSAAVTAPDAPTENVPRPRVAEGQTLFPSRTQSQQTAGGRSAPDWHPAAFPGPGTEPTRSSTTPPPAGPPSQRQLPGSAALPEPPSEHRSAVGPSTAGSVAGTSAFRRSAIGGPAADRSAVADSAGDASGGAPGSRPGDVRSIDTARSRRRRWVGGLAAAAAVAAIGTTVIALQHPAGGTDVAGIATASLAPAPAPAGNGGNAIQLSPGRFGDALTQIQGRHSTGRLTDFVAYISCLRANSIDEAKVSGVTAVTFRGAPATAIAVDVDAHSSRIVVVGPNCGVNGAADQLAAENATH